MNGYNLLRNWYNFKFENPSKVKAIHSDMYCYLIDLWNRLGQKNEFGLPTSVTMEALQIGSFNTYKKTFDDLVNFGFIILIKESKNQYQSRIIAISKNDEATDKALDKAHIKATDKALDTIIKQRTNNNKQDNNKEINNNFIEWFNKMINKHLQRQGKFKCLNTTDINNLKKLKKENYEPADWEKAFISMSKNNWVIEQNMCNPSHFLRPDNFQRYVNQFEADSKPKFSPYG